MVQVAVDTTQKKQVIKTFSELILLCTVRCDNKCVIIGRGALLFSVYYIRLKKCFNNNNSEVLLGAIIHRPDAPKSMIIIIICVVFPVHGGGHIESLRNITPSLYIVSI